MSINITTKQLEVLRVIVKGNPDDSLTDMDQVLECIKYVATKEAMQFTIRSLIKRELILKAGSESRRGRRRVLYEATELGQHYGRALLAPTSFVHSEEDDELLESLGSLGLPSSTANI
jgi:DNA-binding MarR family transcriptional regulator